MAGWGRMAACSAAVTTALLAAGCMGMTVNATTLKPADASRLAGGTTYQYDHFRITLPQNWAEQSSTEISGGRAYSGDLAQLIVVPQAWRADRLFSYWVKDYEATLKRDPEWFVQKEWKITVSGHEGRLFDLVFRRGGAQIAVIDLGPGQAVELRYTAQRAILDDDSITLFHTIIQSIEFETPAAPPGNN